MEFQHVVCHRGLHDSQLDQANFDKGLSQKVTREQLVFPVENTLRAYHGAWTKGYTLAECDISVTLDGQVFLCHDETFERVGALVDNALALRQATSLQSFELSKVRLRDESSPTLLRDCLALAHQLSTTSSRKRMVLELKQDGLFPSANTPIDDEQHAKDNLESAMRMVNVLCDMFDQDPSLLNHVALLFSFGPDVMKALCAWKLVTKHKVVLMQLTEGSKFLPQNKTLRVDLQDSASVEKGIQFALDSGLDGLYLEFEDDMVVSNSLVQQNLQRMCQQLIIGVWSYETQLDGLAPHDNEGTRVFETLVKLGVTFVNANI